MCAMPNTAFLISCCPGTLLSIIINKCKQKGENEINPYHFPKYCIKTA